MNDPIQPPIPNEAAEPAPLSLEQYARITAAYMVRRGPHDSTRTTVFNVLSENNLTLAQWARISAYWTPKVNDSNDPVSAQFKTIVEQETERLKNHS